MPPIPKWILVAIILVSFIGFLDATYLTVKNYTQGILPCIIFNGCETVLNSSYSKIGAIPISLIGAGYYLLFFITAILYIDIRHAKALKALIFMPVFGFVASLWFVYLQIFVLKAICFYCMVSAVSSTALFAAGMYLLYLIKNKGRITKVK